MNSLPKTVTRQRHDCDLNPGPSAPESSTLTTRLPSHPITECMTAKNFEQLAKLQARLHRQFWCQISRLLSQRPGQVASLIFST